MYLCSCFIDKKKVQRFLLLIIWFVFSQVADAQDILRGLVLDGETGEPIVGATVYDAKRGKVLTVTDTDGKFRIPNNGYLQLKITYIGYKTLLTPPNRDGRYPMQAEISKIGDVVVTAQESRGLTSSCLPHIRARKPTGTMCLRLLVVRRW